MIEKNYFLHKSAQEAYKSYIRAYDSHSLKQIFNVNNLNLPHVALSFGFKVPPFVDLSILFFVVMNWCRNYGTKAFAGHVGLALGGWVCALAGNGGTLLGLVTACQAGIVTGVRMTET